MIKRLSRIIIAAAFVVGFFNINTQPAQADVGEFPSPGGVITPGDKTEDIEMKSEDVLFTVKKNTNTFENPEYNTHYAHVKASFTMHNKTSSDVSKQLFFPFHNSVWSDEDMAIMAQVKNTSVKVNDQKVSTTFTDNIFTYEDETNVASAVFNTSFKANADTSIVVEYDLRAINRAKSNDLVFWYMMETGSHWAGNIGYGKITFDFEEDITSLAPFANVSDSLKPQDGNLVWEFSNLEPSSDHNLEVIFNPNNLATWQNRPSIIKDIKASRTQSMVWETADVRRDYPDYPGSNIDSNVVSTIDYQDENGGWLVTQADNSFDEWVEYDFDGSYEVESIQIRGGYKHDTYPIDSSGEPVFDDFVTFYNTYRTPKNIVITYSDGSTQEAKLQNKPSEYQTIKLNKTPTSFIKINFKDAYDGTGNGNKSFGMGRIKFANAVKVAEETNQDNTDNQQDSTENNNLIQQYLPWIVGGSAGLVIVVTAAVIIIRKKKQPKAQKVKPTTVETTEEQPEKTAKKDTPKSTK